MADELPNVSLNLPAMKDFRDGVAAGEIRFEPEAARQAAAVYDHTVEGLEQIKKKLGTLVGRGQQCEARTLHGIGLASRA